MASSKDTEALAQADRTECENEPLTAISVNSERCANPFCIIIKAQRGKRYCLAPCRMDGYALKRAKALLNRVGIIRFHELLDGL